MNKFIYLASLFLLLPISAQSLQSYERKQPVIRQNIKKVHHRAKINDVSENASQKESSLPQAEHPNIILIMMDDLGWGDVGFNHHPIIQTPYLDSLASKGIIFDRFYAGAPNCSPTRATLLTGRHHARMKIDQAMYRGKKSTYISHLPNQEITIAELARTEGYTTGHFGKWHLGTLTKYEDDIIGRKGEHEHYSPPWENGYDQSLAMENYVQAYQALNAKFHTGPRTYNPFPENYLIDKETPEVLVDYLLRFVEEAKQKKKHFFTTLWFGAPHRHAHPQGGTKGVFFPNPKDTTYSKYNYLHPNEREYYTVISAVDRQIGRLWKAINSLGIADNTLIVFNSDNGPEHNTRHFGTTGPFRGAKGRFYEGGIRVPAFICWPEKIKGGRRLEYPTVTSDLLPTLLDLWHVSMPDNRMLDGQSILPALFKDQVIRGKPIGFELELVAGKAWMQDTFKIVNAKSKGRGEAIAIIPKNKRHWELFNLWADPAEQRDLSPYPEYDPLLQKMIKEWERWWSGVAYSRQGKDYKAGLLNYHGLLPVITNPGSFQKGHLTRKHLASLVIEKQHFLLDSTWRLQDKMALGGRVVNSFLLHIDLEKMNNIDLSLSFADPILAVITEPVDIKDSNFLAFGQPIMPALSAMHKVLGEMEWQVGGHEFYLRSSVNKDKIMQIRILTSSPLDKG